MQYISSLIELSVFAHRRNLKVNIFLHFYKFVENQEEGANNGVYDDRRFGIVESEELKILKILDVKRTENCQISWNGRYLYLPFLDLLEFRNSWISWICSFTEIKEFENCLPEPLWWFRWFRFINISLINHLLIFIKVDLHWLISNSQIMN